MFKHNVLVTGFDEFGGVHENPSRRLVQELAAAGVPCHTKILPTSYKRSYSDIQASLLSSDDIQFAILIGYASSVTGIRIETVASSLTTSMQTDNDGVVGGGSSNSPGEFLPATLDVPKVRNALSVSGLPITTSKDAGGYVCNALFYRALSELSPPLVGCGFFHIGDFPEASLHQYVQAFESLVKTLMLDEAHGH